MRRLIAGIVGLILCAPLIALLPAHASHEADGAYDLPIWFYWGETNLDVLIVPPNHGQIVNGNGVLNGGDPAELTPFNSYLKAIEDSIADWDRGMQMFGPDWLAAGVVTNVYVIGRDSIPTAVLTDPEIVVTTDETKTLVLGVAISTRPCIVDNSKFFITSFTYEDMYNINSQEYGHCLGLHHVVDNHPGHDAMAGLYEDNVGAKGNHLHCVSNLDVKGLEAVFGGHFGKPTPKTVSLPVAQYGTTCAPPAAAPVEESPPPPPQPTSSPVSTPSPTPTPTPSASPEDPPDPPSHEQHLRTITLRLRRHLVASGNVTASDGHTACEANARVEIVKRRGSQWKSVATTTTSSSGSFWVRIPDRQASYRATTEGTQDCSGATSPTRRHRHG